MFELIKQLETIDHTNKYKILVLANEKDYYTPKNPNFEVLVANYAHYSFAEQLAFARFLYSLKVDLVHFYMPQQPLLYTKPAITTVHDLNLLRITENDMHPIELRIKKAIFAILLRIVAHKSKHILTPTRYTKNDLTAWSHISPQKVTVTHLGAVDVTKPKPVSAYKNTPFIMYLGRGEPYKNNRRLILAHQKLIRTNTELTLIIAGGIDELRQADIDWVAKNNFKNVIFTGWISDESAAWLEANCLAFVNPSYLEGFGLPALEAMQHGAPVVSANTTCSPEVLGGAAHYFDPFSVDDMARAIKEVITNKQLQRTLKTKGAQQVKKYSWVTMAKQTHAVYMQALAKKVGK